SRAAGRTIRELSLPDGAVVALVARADDVIPPRGSTRLSVGDHAFLVVRSAVRQLVDRVFTPRGLEAEDPLPSVEFPLAARTQVADLVEFYGIEVDASPDATLEDLIRARTGGADLVVGTTVDLGSVRLRVREVSSEGVEVVGLQVLP
ncbi:MAG TPA: TrkA C-terminal domain-containing protein, partial [Longimicrobiales bacterium]|nr:TrkA C-terminal domain-containing protein [Longimicrobiales bacterium]